MSDNCDDSDYESIMYLTRWLMA